MNKKIKQLYAWLYRMRFVHFFVVGLAGVIINLSLVVSLTELVFGRENYFIAYLIGLSANLVFNFILHAKLTFQTASRPYKRFSLFVLYNVLMSALQAVVVDVIVDMVGVNWYFVVIVATIGMFFLLNFVVSKWFLFDESRV